ncbi:hypothetical protein BGZ61DRAFT_98942 [Ilyonectria robusta]|uniref:uncharacterized protein n=1 Tax=Ilyonectria robusta TaxID=1079257 RepID=UPI001E8DB7B9|nr:uncharacterized protein BGZ61DRAFT_98942 [Ilyonectria robusta]KAH8675028.1 hypothetical protein BGZ61DRAFT_98942 [Ilyonectria robusta]
MCCACYRAGMLEEMRDGALTGVLDVLGLVWLCSIRHLTVTRNLEFHEGLFFRRATSFLGLDRWGVSFCLHPDWLPFPLVIESLLARWRGRRRCRRCRIMHQWPYWHPYTSNLRLVADYGRSNYHAPNMEAARGRLLDDSHDPCLTLKVEGKKKAHRSGRGPGQGSSC